MLFLLCIYSQIYLLNKKDYKNARLYLEKAKESGDKQKIDKFGKRSVYVLLAEVYVKTGEPDKALELYKKLLRLFPESKAIKNKINEIHQS